MKKIAISAFALLSALSVTAQESGINFFKGTWAEAIEQAKKENKKVFVDFYTDWCGPCMIMSRDVFVLPEVGEVYNKHFVCMKIDAEKGEGGPLARKYKVASYPTYLYIDPASEQITHRSGGNKPAQKFIEDAISALDPGTSSVYLEETYAQGGYDVDFLRRYIAYKSSSGARELPQLMEELMAKTNGLDDPDVWTLFVKTAKNYRTPYFQEVVSRYDHFTELYGKKEVDEKLAAMTAYAPAKFLESLPDFDGRHHNIEAARITSLLNEGSLTAVYERIEQVASDSAVDKDRLVDLLRFHVRITPKRGADQMTFEQLLERLEGLRYVAYNTGERTNAQFHYDYASGLEYVLRRAVNEGKEIPLWMTEPPRYGKKEYDMRDPNLKPKPQRITQKPTAKQSN